MLRILLLVYTVWACRGSVMTKSVEVLSEAPMTSYELGQGLRLMLRRNVYLPFKLLSHRDCHLRMEVLRSSAFIAANCPGYSRRRKYILLISSANMSIGIAFANTPIPLHQTLS